MEHLDAVHHEAPTSEPRILIVEDDIGIREAMKSLFEMVSIDASFAGSGEEALSALRNRKSPPSLIVLDGLTPKLRGDLKVEVSFGVDADGILHVKAADQQSGVAQEAHLQVLGAPTQEVDEA